MPSSFKRQVAGQPLAQVDNPDPFAVPVWRSPVYQTPHFLIWPVQLVRLVWRIVWFVLRHPLLDAGCTALVFTWLKLGWPGLVALAAVAVTGARRGLPAVAGMVHPARRPGGAGLLAALVLPAPLDGRDDTRRARPHLPGPRPGAGPRRGTGGRGGGPGDGAAGDRAGSAGLRRPDTEPRPRVRRATVPGPRRPAGPGDAGVRPLRHPRRPDRRAARRPRGEPGRAAGGPLRGRDRRGCCGCSARTC